MVQSLEPVVLKWSRSHRGKALLAAVRKKGEGERGREREGEREEEREREIGEVGNMNLVCARFPQRPPHSLTYSIIHFDAYNTHVHHNWGKP